MIGKARACGRSALALPLDALGLVSRSPDRTGQALPVRNLAGDWLAGRQIKSRACGRSASALPLDALGLVSKSPDRTGKPNQ